MLIDSAHLGWLAGNWLRCSRLAASAKKEALSDPLLRAVLVQPVQRGKGKSIGQQLVSRALLLWTRCFLSSLFTLPLPYCLSCIECRQVRNHAKQGQPQVQCLLGQLDTTG